MDKHARPTEPRRYPYRHIAWCYDAIASAYSLRAIGRSKRWHLSFVKPGMRVLYLGAGTGKEAAAAVAMGAEVTCIEPCPAMARRLRRRLDAAIKYETVAGESSACKFGAPRDNKPNEKLGPRIHMRGLDQIEAEASFDLVCGHYFFNLFDPAAMRRALAMAAAHIRPGGQLVIADFAPPQPPTRPRRLLHNAYYRPVNWIGWALRMCALHPIYDYTSSLNEQGFTVEHRAGFACLAGTPVLYEAICLRKKRGG
jgi:ubiquinone/menaquinone biosynthesis C-methylase UbiE